MWSTAGNSTREQLTYFICRFVLNQVFVIHKEASYNSCFAVITQLLLWYLKVSLCCCAGTFPPSSPAVLIRPCEVTLFWESVCFPKTNDFPPMSSLWESLGRDRDARLRVPVYNSLSPSHLSPLWLMELWCFSRGLIHNICEGLLLSLCFIGLQWSTTRPDSAQSWICWNN